MFPVRKQKGLILLLSKGNTKIGRIWQFSLPARITCPGRSKTCVAKCYALKHRYYSLTVISKLDRSLKAARKPSFVPRVIEEIEERRIPVVRIHAAGDFYSPGYARKWLKIARECPETKFYFYSRSWRIPEIRKVLVQLSRLKNVRAFYSCDRDTGKPLLIPKRVRLAYLKVEEGEEIPAWADLVFRDHKLRKSVQIRDNGVLVCPVENGKQWKGSCESCGLCMQSRDIDVRDLKRPTELPTRRSLVVL